jgi:hypothetical protein
MISITDKPGKCKLCSYKFIVETDQPIVGYSRPIPLALRLAVRQQVEQMIQDDILEVSNSPMNERKLGYGRCKKGKSLYFSR